jgi:hypothetical protein
VDALVERDEQLAALGSVVETARDGRGQLVLVAGEAGIGKTSLVRALRERLGDRASFLLGACEPLSVPVPLAPWREIAGAEPSDVDALAFALSVLGVLRARAPAVAVLEDAYWADPATVDVLRLLARRVEEAGVVLIVTYRDDELAVNPALAMLVGDLVTGPAARRMALEPLSHAAVRSMAGATDVDADGLWRITGGNPFLVVEALAARDGLPASVRDATLARVGRLGSVARGVVDAAAVIGRRVPLDLLTAVAPAAADAVEEALARGVLTDDGATLGFRHELTRQAVESAISAPRRAQLHAAVVAALAQRVPATERHGSRITPSSRASRNRPAGTPRSPRRRRSVSVRCGRPRCSWNARCACAPTCPTPSASSCCCASPVPPTSPVGCAAAARRGGRLRDRHRRRCRCPLLLPRRAGRAARPAERRPVRQGDGARGRGRRTRGGAREHRAHRRDDGSYAFENVWRFAIGRRVG